MKAKFRILIFSALIFCAFRAQSQSFIVQAGFSLAEIKDSGSGTLVLDSKAKPGFHAGISSEFSINKNFSFLPGLMYSNKGAKYDQNILGSRIKITGSLHYLDVPLLFKATGEMQGGTKVFAVLGPYVGFGLAGKAKSTVTDSNGDSESSSAKFTWGNGDDDYAKRVEMGATAGVGLEFKSFLASVNYDLGITNISNSSNQTGGGDDVTSRNRVLRLTIGYRIGAK